MLRPLTSHPEHAAPTSDATREMLAAKLDEVFASHSWVRTVLDLGCGNGVATAIVLQRLLAVRPQDGRLLCCDADEGKVREASARLTALGLEQRVRLFVGDLYQLPVRPGSLDCVVALNVFHGVRRVRFARQILQVLAPCGILLAYDRLPERIPFARLAFVLDREKLQHLVDAQTRFSDAGV